MTFNEHIEALKKEMTTMANQMNQNKAELDRSRQDVGQIQSQVAQISDTGIQQELNKLHETTKKLDQIARTYLQHVSDSQQQAQLMAELDAILKNGVGMPVLTPPMMNAVAAMHPNMMMRNPMMNAMSGASPRVGKGVPNGGMNGAMFQQMQLAMQQAALFPGMQMFPGMPMMGVPGMLPGMPPGMAGLPGMMPANSAAAAAAAMQQFQQQQLAAAIAVSTPSRNQSTSGAASRTRTPLTASATNSPRPNPVVVEPVIKEEEPPSMETGVSPPVTATATIKQEENSTVAVA